MDLSEIKAIVFDKDGTLFDFGTTWEAWAAAFLVRLCDGDTARATQLGAQIGFDLDARRFAPESVVIAGTPAQVAAALAAHIPTHTETALLEILNEEAAIAPQAEAVPLAAFLDRLSAAGLILGVATNDAERPARAHLDAAGVTDRFAFIAGSDSGFGGKPAPGQLQAFCAAVGIAPQDCVMVGDSLHDLHAGQAAGMITVGVLTGIASEQDLAPHADVVFADVGHIPHWLGLR